MATPPKATLPTKKALTELVKAIKFSMRRFRPDELEDGRWLSVTVGADGKGRDSWSYQTGDNSFMGGAYGYPHWAVVSVSRRCNSGEVADEILTQLWDLVDQSV
jgi:hypothetical protein